MDLNSLNKIGNHEFIYIYTYTWINWKLNNYLISRYLPAKHLSITKNNFIVKKCDRYRPKYVIKAIISSNGTNWNHMSQDRLQGKHCSITCVLFLPTMHKLNLIMRKHQTDTKQLSCILRKCQGLESQGKIEDLF